MKTKKTTIFSWGYWGWGNATKQLIGAVDDVEASRGYGPPLFVEVRFLRGGRAPGFRGDTFERAVGRERYLWMKDLGNKAVANDSGRRIQIARPQAANDLLDLALDAAEQNRRVIFFCACEVPAHCHRAAVAKLVSAAANRRAAPVEIIEWPGGEPRTIELPVSEPLLSKIARGAKSVPLPRAADLAQFAGLPWYSHVILEGDDDELETLASPASYGTKLGWHLKILAVPDGEVDDAIRQFRHEQGYDAVA